LGTIPAEHPLEHTHLDGSQVLVRASIVLNRDGSCVWSVERHVEPAARLHSAKHASDQHIRHFHSTHDCEREQCHEWQPDRTVNVILEP
jgi:hypothetical protein